MIQKLIVKKKKQTNSHSSNVFESSQPVRYLRSLLLNEATHTKQQLNGNPRMLMSLIPGRSGAIKCTPVHLTFLLMKTSTRRTPPCWVTASRGSAPPRIAAHRTAPSKGRRRRISTVDDRAVNLSSRTSATSRSTRHTTWRMIYTEKTASRSFQSTR